MKQPTTPNPICDFCSAPNPTVEFPCRDFTMPFLPLYESVGSWWACEACTGLAVAGKWPQLLARGLEAHFAKDPGGRKHERELRAVLSAFHARFRSNMLNSVELC